MSELSIITNNHERQFKYGYEVPESVKADFDHLSDDEMMDGWIQYRSVWYHLSDFMHISVPSDNMFFTGWHGYSSDSFFSGVLIKISDDGETYQIGTYLS